MSFVRVALARRLWFAIGMARPGAQLERGAGAPPADVKQVVSPRLLRPLDRWLRTLRRPDAHGNRRLFADQVVIAHLLAYFSPALKSLRRIEDVFEHPVVRRKFNTPRIPKSTLSDAQRLFDPRLLTPLIDDLRRRVRAQPHDARLDALTRALTAVDGTFMAVAPRVAWALYNKPNSEHKPRKGNVRVDVHFNVLSGVPEQAIVSDGRTPEYQTLAEHLEADRFYVLDRAYHCYRTLAEIIAAGSDFLVRLRADMLFDALEDHPLSADERLSGVLRCQTVRVHGWRGRQALGERSLKLVEIYQPAGKPLRLLTNRVDLAPEIVSVAYRHRWQIELFFRWLKCLLNFRHFFSESENGLALQIAVALIGTLLIALEVGARPSVYDYAMMTHVISGLVPPEGVAEILARRRAERARDAERKRARRAAQKNK